jgi:hypothetical protein
MQTNSYPLFPAAVNRHGYSSTTTSQVHSTGSPLMEQVHYAQQASQGIFSASAPVVPSPNVFPTVVRATAQGIGVVPTPQSQAPLPPPTLHQYHPIPASPSHVLGRGSGPLFNAAYNRK